jgi:hypothetical protein
MGLVPELTLASGFPPGRSILHQDTDNLDIDPWLIGTSGDVSGSSGNRGIGVSDRTIGDIEIARYRDIDDHTISPIS